MNGLIPTSSECSATETSVTSTTSTTVPASIPTIDVATGNDANKFLVTLGATTARTIALSLGMRVPSDARASLVVAQKSKTVCRISKSKITAIKVGRCTVNVTVTHRPGWKATKTTTLIVSRIS